MSWNWCDSGCSAPVVWRDNGVALCAHCYVELIENSLPAIGALREVESEAPQLHP